MIVRSKQWCDALTRTPTEPDWRTLFFASVGLLVIWGRTQTMDLLYFLNERLKFIEQLYDGAVSDFAETKRKIDEQEPPYVDNRDPEYASEPAFLREWDQADDSIMVIGHWALCMVHASLKAYLQGCIGATGPIWWRPKTLLGLLAKKQGKSWFVRYQRLFLEDLGIDFSKGPVPLSALEQLNLTRDDVIHNVDVLSVSVGRNEKHAQLYPNGLFTDVLWARAGIERVRIDKEKLHVAIELVQKFCAWIDAEQRT